MSVSVIGGADVPTAIFVASSTNWWFVFGIAVVVGAILVTMFLINKKKK